MGSKLCAVFAVARGLVSLAVLLGFALVRFVLEQVGLVKSLGADEKQPYLEGNWGPVDDEVKIDNLEIVGEIPKHLDGEFVRNGPNPQFKEQVYKNYHWFDGDGMLHGVRLENGKATYVNRWVRTERFEQERKAKRPLHVLLGQMRNAPTFLASSLFNQLLIALHLRPKLSAAGTANTALTYHDGHLLALVENDAPTVIKLPYLETLGRHNYDGKLTHPFTAHPKVDAETGECMFFGYRFDKKPYVCYSLINNKGELVSTVGINAIDVPVMMHDFAVTKHYSIIMNLPFTFRIERLFNGEPLFQFEEDRKSKFGIIPRHARREEEIIWFEAKPGFVFHTVNAWEEGDEVVLVACRSKATSSLGLSKDDVDYSDKYKTNLYEWRFNLKSRGTKERYLDNLRVEFPVVNESLIGVKSRYTYTAHFIEDPMPYMDGVVKYDLQQNTADGKLKPKIFFYGDNKFGGECVFVPAHKPTSEDDGYLITYVYDETTKKSELWIIDAKTMETVVARVKIPRRIPFGFHGKWVTQDQIVNQKPFPVLRK